MAYESIELLSADPHAKKMLSDYHKDAVALHAPYAQYIAGVIDMESTIVEHTGEDFRKYELRMRHLPDDPDAYFNETVVGGFENWVWVGCGTAQRKDETGREYEMGQVCG